MAARVVQLGAGILLEKQSQQAIRQEVRQVLEDPAYRENAAAISAGFRRCSGAKGAADKILQVCGG